MSISYNIQQSTDSIYFMKSTSTTILSLDELLPINTLNHHSSLPIIKKKHSLFLNQTFERQVKTINPVQIEKNPFLKARVNAYISNVNKSIRQLGQAQRIKRKSPVFNVNYDYQSVTTLKQIKLENIQKSKELIIDLMNKQHKDHSLGLRQLIK